MANSLATSIMDKIYNQIDFYDGFNPVLNGMDKIGEWRDEDSTIVRKVVFGAALVGSSLCFLIDLVASLALAIITSPLELFGIHLAINFAGRSVISGAWFALCLIYFQYANVANEKFTS